ncbi:MAG: hypothetical protein WC755_09620 [Candidatus Woesearchaeota archaeon]|jgi:hypothetical protein
MRNIIKKDIYERETTICKNLSKENGGKCCWGECGKCGVLPILYKLHKGVLLEEPDEIAKMKNKIFSKT